jgi:hypothetical protein
MRHFNFHSIATSDVPKFLEALEIWEEQTGKWFKNEYGIIDFKVNFDICDNPHGRSAITAEIEERWGDFNIVWILDGAKIEYQEEVFLQFFACAELNTDSGWIAGKQGIEWYEAQQK